MVLQLIDVSRTYGTQRALDGVSIHVRRGDCYAFIGHNGAGKTTAMRVALGLDPHFDGRVLIDGFDTRSHPREARARMGGLIEVPGFHGALDGPRNLVFLAQVQGLSRHEASREASRLIELVGLSHAGSKPVAAYSQGMRQRLGIAQALIGRPMCVLLDEPTNGLDPQGIADMQALFTRLTRDEGLTVLLSSHHLAQISGLVNRVGVLHQGRLLVEAETRELLGETNGRYKLELDRPEEQALARVLEPLGVGARASPSGGLRLEVGTRAPSAVLQKLVASGIAVRSFAPDPPSLEEIYLEYARRANDRPLPGGGAGAPETSAASARPTARLAPTWPVPRVVRYELERVWSRGRILLLLGLPAALALVSVLRLHSQARALAEEVQKGELFSTTEVTAFQAAGGALQAGLPLCGILAVGLASQSIAGELSRGTLRNLLLRPVTRIQAAIGKLGAQLLLVAGSYALLACTALLVSAWFFDFRGVAEILPDGQRYDLVAAEDLVPELRRALFSPWLPLIAYSALGLLAGALARGAAGALALGLGLFASLDLLRTVARGFDFEGALPSAYLPSPLGDTSFLAFYSDVAQGVSNANFAYASTALAAPAAWAALAFAAGVLLLSRRSVPMMPLRTLVLAQACLGLGACSALLAGPEKLPQEAPPLAGMEEPFDLQAEPQDEPARQLLPAGSFSGIYVVDARASLDAMLEASEGVAVERVVENSPGEAAGIEEGDLLLSVRTGDGSTISLHWPSEWRAVELAQSPGSEIELVYDRAGAERTARVALVPRVHPAERTPAVRLREELRVGVVLRSATEVEARAADLAPGAGAVVVGLTAESPWRSAGVRFEDLILAVDSAPVAHPQVVLDLVRSAEPEAKLRLSIARGAERLEIEAPTSKREGETSHVYVPVLFSYERERGASETSMLLGLIRVRKTPAAWDVRLLWFISFGGGDADKLEPVRY